MRLLLLVLSLVGSHILHAQPFKTGKNFPLEQYHEIVRDSLAYAYVVEDYELEKHYKAGTVSAADYASKKASVLQRKKQHYLQRQQQRSALISSTGLNYGAETNIAINPNNPNHVVTAYMAATVAGVEVSYSTNGGLTWTTSTFDASVAVSTTIPNINSYDGGGDPVISFDKNGNIYFAWIAMYTTPTGMYYATLYVKSTNGGATFTVPALADFVITEYNQFGSPYIFDRLWMAADHSSGAYAGTVYINGVLFYQGPSVPGLDQLIYVKNPTGSHFTVSPNASLPAYPYVICQLANMKVDNNGVVHVTAIREDSLFQGQLVYSRSYDQGQTWTPIQIIANAPITGQYYFFDLDNAAPSLAVDGNYVYLAWTNVGTTPCTVWYAVSANGGVSWGAPVNVGAQVCPGPYHHSFINIAASGGNFSAAWFNIDTSTSMGHYVMAEIQNYGANVMGYEVISPSNSDLSQLTNYVWMGHYNQSARSGCTTYTIWANEIGGYAVVYTATVNACYLGMPEISNVNGGVTINSVFPNPAKNELTIDFTLSAAGEHCFSVFNSEAKQMLEVEKNNFSSGKNSFSINVSSLAAGVYLVCLKNQQGVYTTRRFVKE